MSTSARLIVLDNALDHAFYRPVEHWSAVAGRSLEAVWVAGGEDLPAPGVHTHVILTGSEASIIARAEWAERERAWLRDAVAHGARVLGSCWGHQLIAVALGGPECVRRAAAPEFGWLDVTVADPAGLLPASGFATFVAHFDEVIAGSHADLHVLAASSACEVHALRWGALPVWGIQGHPEVDPATGRFFLEQAIERWPRDAGTCRAALAAPVRDSGAARPILDAFLAT